ncbi:ARF guanine-nucleotide exchange factor GNOM [Apostasia shenzhenica]|uniref:ARF guanine-nucleotide exchange factor GNOM n=1 Tax=Apostasia shenzhenica TaxID=1088818 RepID=A0A2I0BE49_9ASPA|nr:ARF guanine-nucleotide exchange factor GNOM [Apostasia shenzhenica]
MGHLRLQQPGMETMEAESPADSSEDRSSTQGMATSSSASCYALACMISSEVSAVLAVMRRNVRWGGRYGSAADDYLDHSLIQSLKSLRRQIFSWDPSRWRSIDPSLYLRPFLDVICSDETGAPITGVALSSVYKILILEVFDVKTNRVEDAMHAVVDAVTSCRFEVIDPASEEAVLMKILQVLLACMKSRASKVLSNQLVITIVNTCFRVVHQAGTKGELLQRISRHTMHELVRCIFAHLPEISKSNGKLWPKAEMKGVDQDQASGMKQFENGNGSFGPTTESLDDNLAELERVKIMEEPYGIPCMREIFHFLCSLLNVMDHTGMNPVASDEDVPLFALGMINSAIELGGSSISRHPDLLSLIQDELFRNLLQFGFSMSPLVLSTVCSIVLNLYTHLRTELKLQLEAFFSCVILRLAQGKYGASYHQQEVAMEVLVDFCRQKTFMSEMYANFDCDISCCNVFEDLTSILSRCVFPVNGPLSAMHILALDGLIAMVQAMADRVSSTSPRLQHAQLKVDEYTPFWSVKCENYADPEQWLDFVHHQKYLKKRLSNGADHFNRDPKRGLEYLQGIHLLPEKLDPHSVACLFRYTTGLDKNLVGDFLGNHEEFCIQVLHEFACTFDFQDMSLDTALRIFLGTFRLPGESQKIQRVLEAFSERYYEQTLNIFVNKDAALLLSYSIILLNTDQHNVQVRKKMTEEDFIRNNRYINGGNDLPREFLSNLYHSICKKEIRITPDPGFGSPEMSPSHWIDLIRKSKKTPPYIVCSTWSYLDYNMFAAMSGPTIAAISVVFDHAEDEDALLTCMEGFLCVAKISAHYHLEDVLDDIVVSLCKFTTLLNTSLVAEPITVFSDDLKARLATETVFSIANSYGDHIRSGWKNIVDCILRLHKFGLLPACVTSDATDDRELPADTVLGKPTSSSLAASHTSDAGINRKPSGLIERFSQLLYFDTEEPSMQPTEQLLASQQITIQTIEKCHIESIFTESKFLQADSLLHLTRSLISAAGRPQKFAGLPDDEDTAVFCLELLIAVTLNNRDRIVLLWNGVYEHITNVVQSVVMPCALVEKAVFGLLRICQRLLPYKENLADELLRSLQLILKLDARVADAYFENITQEVTRLVKANATHIRSHMGWKTITSLLSITARHHDASEVGFEALVFIMLEGAHLTPANYVLFIEASRQFADSRLGKSKRSAQALNLMVESIACLNRWAQETKDAGQDAEKIMQGIQEMWLKLVQALRKVTSDEREEIRNHAISSLQICLTGVEGICPSYWHQVFDTIIFSMMDDFLEIIQSHPPKNYWNMEGTLVHTIKLLSKVFLQQLLELSMLSSFGKLWLGILDRMEKYMKVKVRGKRSEKLQELVPELLKNILLVMKSKGILAKSSTTDDNSMWDSTSLHLNKFAPFLWSEVLSDKELQQNDSIDVAQPGQAEG